MNRLKVLVATIGATVLLAGAVPTVAFAQTNNTNANISKEATDDKVYNEKMKDPLFVKKMNEAKASKTHLARFESIDKQIGYTEFWSNLDLNKLDEYKISSDGSVKKKGNSFSLDAKEDKNFVTNLNGYLTKIDKLNKKNGIATNPVDADSEGNISIGSLSGPSPNNFKTPINVGAAVIGDVFLGSYPGIHEQGEIEHAGIFDGTQTDQCLWSIDGPNQYSTWDRISEWKQYFNEVWDMNIWPTSTAEAKAAFNKAKADSLGKTYGINADITSSSDFYCSKIPWWGYKYTGSNYDLRRPNFLPAVTPTLIYNCVWSSQRNYWKSN